MAYGVSYPEKKSEGALLDFANEGQYERFIAVWELDIDSAPHKLSYNYKIIRQLFLRCLLKVNNLRILAFLLQHEDIPLVVAAEMEYFSLDPYEELAAKLPLNCIADTITNPYLPYDRPALYRLLLYCRGIEPFFTIQDQYSHTAQWYYERNEDEYHRPLPIINGTKTIKTFIEDAWHDIQVHDDLLEHAVQTAKNHRYAEAYQQFDKAALQLRDYAEGDKSLVYFYEEEMFTIYKQAVELMYDDRLQMVAFIASNVLPKQRYLDKHHPLLTFFEEQLRAPKNYTVRAAIPVSTTLSSDSSTDSTPLLPHKQYTSSLRRRKVLSSKLTAS